MVAGALIAALTPGQILGFVSLVLGILLALGGLAYPSVSRKSLRATIDVLLLQKQVTDGRVADLETENARLRSQIETLVHMQDRKVAAAIIAALIEDGRLEPRSKPSGE
jgi:hypothetical protein